MFSGFEWAVYIFRPDENEKNERYVRAKIFFESRSIIENPHIGVVYIGGSNVPSVMERYSLTRMDVAKFIPCGFTHERLEFLDLGKTYISDDLGEYDAGVVFNGLHVFSGSNNIFAKVTKPDGSVDYLELRYFLTFRLKAQG